MVRYKQVLTGFVGEPNSKGYINIQIIGATLQLRNNVKDLKTNSQGTMEVSGEYKCIQNFQGTKAVFSADSLDSFKPNA